MKYVTPPLSVSFNRIKDKEFCFAPSKFASFFPRENLKTIRFEKLGNIIVKSNIREKIENNKKYIYLEIGDININNGGINYNELFGIRVPTKSSLKTKYGDILISKVRTYRKGIGFVSNTNKNIVCTPAFIVIEEVKNNIPKNYLYSVLRHDFFVEQIVSLQNRGMYPRLDNDTEGEVFIPIPKDASVSKYISLLTDSIISKESEIKRKFELLNDEIENELLKNQKNSRFIYQYPDYNEVNNEKRLDTGVYKEEYKQIINLITNYKNGFFYIPKTYFKSGNTPPDRVIGKGNNIWVTPSDVSPFGYLSNKGFILCKRNNINKNCILIINRTSKGGLGEYVGIAFYYDYLKLGKAQHNQGCYRIEDYEESYLKYIPILLNSKFYRKLCGCISLGSKMKEIKIPNFEKIPFPKFKDEFINKLITNYFTNYKYSTKLTFDNYEKLDAEATSLSGILDLSYQIIKLKEKINKVISNLLSDESIDMSFTFLETN